MIGGVYHIRDAAGGWVPAAVQRPVHATEFPVLAGMWSCREWLGRQVPKRPCVARVALCSPIDGIHFADRSPSWVLLIDGARAAWNRWDRLKRDEELTPASYRRALVRSRRAVIAETINPYF